MKNTKLSTLLLFCITSLTTLISADTGEGSCGMGSMMFGTYGAGPMAFGWIFSTLTLIILVLLIFWLIKQIQKR